MEISRKALLLISACDVLRVSLQVRRERRLDCQNSIEMCSDWCLPENQFSPIQYPSPCGKNALPPVEFVPWCSLFEILQDSQKLFRFNAEDEQLTDEPFAFCTIVKC